MLFPVQRFRLYLIVLIVNLLYVSTGCVVTWPSPVLARLPLGQVQAGWVGSLMALGGVLGPPLSSVGLARLGRRGTLLGAGAAFLLGWALLAASASFPVICIGRLVGGLALGVSFIITPIYLTEVADDGVRQSVTTMTEFFLGLGYLIVYIGGPYLSYLMLQVVCGVVSLSFIALFSFMPETPHHLVSLGRIEEATKALAWIRNTQDVQQEIISIQAYQSGSRTKESIMTLMSKPGHTRSFMISLYALFLQQVSGVIVVVSYLEPILETMVLPIDPAVAAIIIGCGNLPSGLIAPSLVSKFGSKMTLVMCSVVMAVCTITLTIYSKFESLNYDLSSVSSIPIVALLFYNVFFCAGLGPLTWSVVAEVTPSSLKGFTSAVTSSFCWVIAFLLLLAYKPAQEALGDWPVYAFFSVCLVLGTVVLQILLPDTKGMSLQDIQLLLAAKSNKQTLECIEPKIERKSATINTDYL